MAEMKVLALLSGWLDSSWWSSQLKIKDRGRSYKLLSVVLLYSYKDVKINEV
jgi:hypothetical protein